jgi:hypothetical protein
MAKSAKYKLGPGLIKAMTLQITVVTICFAKISITKRCALHTECIYVFRMKPRTNIKFSMNIFKPLAFNGDEVRFL